MARVLAISSQVVRGHVGLSAIVPGLQALGHDVLAVPTVVLSNHPGHAHVAGQRLAAETIAASADALAANGWLEEIDAVLTGYLPSVEHVHHAARLVRRLKASRGVVYLCDPVLGDHPKGLYLDPHAATAIRNELLALADIATPNVFELGWLASRPVADRAGTIAVARSLGAACVVVTSSPWASGMLANLLVSDERQVAAVVEHRPHAPHGTGDLFAALLLGQVLRKAGPDDALAAAAGAVADVIAATGDADELRLVARLGRLADAPPALLLGLP